VEVVTSVTPAAETVNDKNVIVRPESGISKVVVSVLPVVEKAEGFKVGGRFATVVGTFHAHFVFVEEGDEVDVGDFVGALLHDLAAQDAKEIVEVDDEEFVVGLHEGHEGAGFTGLGVSEGEEFDCGSGWVGGEGGHAGAFLMERRTLSPLAKGWEQ
jgi:hypothetical protein